MQEITHIIGTKTVNGQPVNIVRKHFLCGESKDYFAATHKEFSKEEKKAAKQQYKANLNN